MSSRARMVCPSGPIRKSSSMLRRVCEDASLVGFVGETGLILRIGLDQGDRLAAHPPLL